MKTQKEKQIRIETTRAIYNLPLRIVAENRAKYYAEKDPKEYDSEYKFTMEDDYEGIDWLQGNMDLDDYQEHLVKVEVLQGEEDFTNAEWSII